MVKKVVVRKSRIQGRGVVATRNFKKGDEILKIGAKGSGRGYRCRKGS